MSEYTKQAEQFLKETDTEFKAEFLTNDLYFPDDKEPRDIYKITIIRKNKGIYWVFKFGQSIKDSNGETKPTAYDVLAGLTNYDPDTFEEFCTSFGYDEDSRKAEKVYNAVVKEWDNVKRCWDEKEIEKLQEIQ